MLTLRYQYDRDGSRIQSLKELRPTSEYQQVINALCAAAIPLQARDNTQIRQAAHPGVKRAAP